MSSATTRLIGLMLVCGLLRSVAGQPAGSLRIVDLSGNYDFNGNALTEVFLVSENVDAPNQSVFIRHVEFDSDGYQHLLWELESEDDSYSRFAGLAPLDIEGDGEPELAVLLNISTDRNCSLRRPILYIFEWEVDGFSAYPAQTLDLSDTRGYLRGNNLQILDRDGDGDQELVVTLSSPRRSLAVIDADSDGIISVIDELKPAALSSGSGFLYSVACDFDGDDRDDLIAFSPEGNILKIQPFYNRAGVYSQGSESRHILPGLNGLLKTAIARIDWDGNGITDVVLPFRSGHVVALTPAAGGLTVKELAVDAGPLTDLETADFNQDDLVDLLLVSGEMNMLSLAYGRPGGLRDEIEYFTLEGEDGAQVFQVLPILSDGVYSGSLVAVAWNGREAEVFISELGRGSPAVAAGADTVDMLGEYPEAVDLIDIFPEIKTVPESRVAAVPAPPPAPEGRVLPEGVLPRHVLTANQTFAYTIPEDDMRRFYSFRWLQTPPRGMFFHYEGRSIRWVPTDAQLGAFQLAFRVEMKVGEKVSLAARQPDSLTTYQVVPELESYDERLWLYVNDPPVIVSEPAGTEFLADARFTYQAAARDLNVDSRIHFSLEEKPLGMTTTPDGFIDWQTDSTHVTAYRVRLVASDGFDRDVQEFTLYPRAGVSILSRADTLAQVGEQYGYDIEVWKPDIAVPLTIELLNGPAGMAIDEGGRLRWTPLATQIDTQRFAIIARHGIASDTQRVAIFVNHPPVIKAAPARIEMIRLGETYDFQIKASDPNAGDRLQYSALVLPKGMRMDPYNGRLLWEPKEENVDFSQLLVAVSDGRQTRMVEAEFFVNAPIAIVSLPPMQAELGKQYKYVVNTSDLNHGSLLPFDHVTVIENLRDVRIYGIKLADENYLTNIQRYIGDWNEAEAVYASDGEQRSDGSVSRLNLKKYVHSIFYEDDQLIMILQNVNQKTVAIKDVLWEFFRGNEGKPPKVAVERLPTVRYSLLEFPDGMEVDELTGTITWTPDKGQIDVHEVQLLVSDGYRRDEQKFQIYVNHPPVIVSKPLTTALVGEQFKYQIIAEDKNADADLRYSLVKGPTGMQISRRGAVVWIPKPSQINNNKFTVKVSDGYREDLQDNTVDVNINPSIISTPKPVALVGYEYRYKLVVEDLNKDRISFRPLRLPKYARFNPKTGLLVWKPRSDQSGANDVIIMAVDERGAATAHEFQIHVFVDPSKRQLVNTGWPLLVTFVGVMFAWGVAQI
ncbi:MAG: putative Ig domain-containing protein [Candidatus Neomarinimicrobiota bacterium]